MLTYNFEHDVKQVTLQKLANWYLNDLFKKEASVLSEMDSIGKFTSEQQKILIAKGQLPNKKRLMDSMRRGAYKKIDSLGGITLDWNDNTGNLGMLSKAKHKILPYLNDNLSLKEKLVIIDHIIQTAENEAQINGAQTTTLKNLLINDFFRKYHNNPINEILKESFIDNLGKTSYNSAYNTPIVIIPKDDHRNVTCDDITGNERFFSSNENIVDNRHIVGIDRNAKQLNLLSLLHETDEASIIKIKPPKGTNSSDYIPKNRIKNNSTFLNNIGRLTNDSHAGSRVIANEAMNSNRIFGNDYNGDRYSNISNFRGMQYNGVNSSQNSRLVNPDFSPIGDLLKFTKTKIPIAIRDKTFPVNNAYLYGMPNLRRKQFIDIAKKVDKWLRNLILNFYRRKIYKKSVLY